MKYNGCNIIEIEKVKGTVYQLDMSVDGKRIRRNFPTLQDAKDEADRVFASENNFNLKEKPLNKNDLLKILKESGVGIDEVTSFLKTDLPLNNTSKQSEKLDSNIPEGKMHEKWENHKFGVKLVNPSNKRKYKILVVGTGLAGASASATLAELGYNVESFTYSDSPRRAHSIAAQGGINAAKNYPNDGDSVHRLFYDTVKGGDYRSREANVHRLAEVSNQIIDHCVAQGIPFAREYGGNLDNRSFGGAQVSRTFYARGQTGQQLLLGAYGALQKEIAKGSVKMHTRCELIDIVVVDGRARGIITRNLVDGTISRHIGDAVVLATGGYGNVFYLSTNAMNCNASAAWRACKRGALFANPCFTQIHPTCIPVHGDYQSKLTLMSESLRNDGRIWVPKNKGDKRRPKDIPENERDYYLERKYPSFGNLVPRDLASRNAKEVCDAGYGVGSTGDAVYLDFSDAISRLGKDAIKAKYGNLFEMYNRITDDDPYETAMMIYPAVHYTMGGLWVDYNLMTTIPGLYAIGEANFSDHGANRLGASALMQGLADGYFVLPSTINNYLADHKLDNLDESNEAFVAAEKEVFDKLEKLLSIKGSRTVDDFHRELGKLMWNECGMERSEEGLKKALKELPKIREEFWTNVNIPGTSNDLNQALEKANRVADFLEFAEFMLIDALDREESCGGHFRIESQTEEGEALRNDEEFAYVAAWEFNGINEQPTLHKEPLIFEEVKLSQRSYK
tara:strand:- start:1230 stop:3434 length:2205 start_codon:yes stop_codon:yes gene_type:complete